MIENTTRGRLACFTCAVGKSKCEWVNGEPTNRVHLTLADVVAATATPARPAVTIPAASSSNPPTRPLPKPVRKPVIDRVEVLITTSPHQRTRPPPSSTPDPMPPPPVVSKPRATPRSKPAPPSGNAEAGPSNTRKRALETAFPDYDFSNLHTAKKPRPEIVPPAAPVDPPEQWKPESVLRRLQNAEAAANRLLAVSLTQSREYHSLIADLYNISERAGALATTITMSGAALSANTDSLRRLRSDLAAITSQLLEGPTDAPIRYVVSQSDEEFNVPMWEPIPGAEKGAEEGEDDAEGEMETSAEK